MKHFKLSTTISKYLEEELRKHKEFLVFFRRSPRIKIGLTFILIFSFMAVFAPWISPYDPVELDLMKKYLPPSLEYPLGTDVAGRDILSRLIWGSRISLCTAVLSVAIGLSIGVLLGVTAGYFGNKVDTLISRIVDVLLAFPAFILALAFMAAMGRGLLNMSIAIGIAISPQLTRLVRGVAMYVRENQFVEAAKSFGIGEWRIIFRHIIPHCLTPVVVYSTLSLGSAVLIEAGLSFLGLGIPPPTPSWGNMIDEGRYVLRDLPWFSTSVGLCIMALVLGFNLLGDGLRDLLDPRLRGELQHG